MALQLGVISLLPEVFESLNHGVTGRAIDQGLATINYWNPRDWAKGSYKRVDDKPYGGGPGMVMMYEPLRGAILQGKKEMPRNTKVIYLSPQGRRRCQKDFNQCAEDKQPLLFISGRYEGIDERVVEHHVDEEWSIGDFVLSGGELATMVCIDAIIRLLPGSLGNMSSAVQDSFMNNLLDYPHYTKPIKLDCGDVPDVLLSGNHQAIARWRRKQALGRTWIKRSDLMQNVTLDKQDEQLLKEFINENNTI